MFIIDILTNVVNSVSSLCTSETKPVKQTSEPEIINTRGGLKKKVVR